MTETEVVKETKKPRVKKAPPTPPPSQPLEQKRNGKYYEGIPDNMIFNDETIEAVDLAPVESIELKYLVPGIRCRWVNFKSHGGAWFDRMVALGFTFATEHDVESVARPNPEAGGKIIFGDLVLMKMPEKKYLGHLKSNAIRAVLATGESMKDAQTKLRQEAAPDTVRAGKPRLVPYVPTQKEVEGYADASKTGVFQTKT